MTKPDIEDAQPAEKSPDHLGPPITEDAVFGEITEEGPNYRDVGIPNQLAVKNSNGKRLDGSARSLS